MKSSRRHSGKGAFDLIEEAVHLLRAAPAATLATYGVGTIPFVLGLLYFWADMSRSPFAHQHVAEGSLGMVALFVWMKSWQAAFARRVRAQVAGEVPQWNVRQCVQMILSQAIVQPSGLFLLPLSLIPALPFAWAYAFYQSATALAGGGSEKTARLVRLSWKQARLWPWQNHFVLSIMAGFGFFAFLNWILISLAAPHLVKTMFGVEPTFARSSLAMLNTTFFAVMFGLTYLCVDPILKTIYTLRCFYGESIESGEDLKAGLKQYAAAAQKLAAMILGVLILLPTTSTKAADVAAGLEPVSQAPADSPAQIEKIELDDSAVRAPSPGRPVAPVVSPNDLDHAINDTIHDRKYTWRMPREKIVEPEAEQGVIARFLVKVGEMLRKWIHTLVQWIAKIIEALFGNRSRHPDSDGFGWGRILSLNALLYTLVAVALIALAILIFRVWRKGRRQQRVIASVAIPSVPDLADENVGAEQLPEDGWTQLARRLFDSGEFRLAMRAFYLASLAHLAQRNLISLARFKSNREYERELRRRGHAFPDLLAVFDENLFAFERIWYGTHEATAETAGRFALNVDKIRGVQ